MTVESFMVWKERFDAELEGLKGEEQRKQEAALKGRLSGKQLFLSKKAVDDDDVQLIIANQVEVDESLFDDMGEIDLEEEADFVIPDS